MYTSILRNKGQFTIPAAVREELEMEENEFLTIIPIYKAFVVIPKKLKSVELLKQSAEMAKKKGITLEEMLAELDAVRHGA